MDWNETKAIMLEVEQLFNRGDDLRDILDIRKMQNEIEQYQKGSLKDARDIIKEMTNLLAAKESEIMAPSDSSHFQQLELFQNERENISSSIANIREEVDIRRESTLSAACECLRVRRQVSQSQESAGAAESRSAYSLSLFQTISRIRWDYTQSGENIIRAAISSASKSEISEFEIDTNKSNFEIANKLWALVEDAN